MTTGLRVWSRPGPAVNVQQFGAAADGTTDDLAAITRAIAALPAGGGGVYFPKGNYLISDRIAVDSSNVQLYGDGPGSKITLQSGSNKHNAVRFNSSGVTDPATVPRLSNVEMCFLQVDSQGGDNTWAVGGLPGSVTVYACDGVSIHHVKVSNGRDYCFNAQGSTDVSFEHLVANGTYWQSACNPINVGGTATISMSDTSVENCRVWNAISLTLTVATRSGTTATFTTSAAHKLTASQAIKVTGCTPSDYNGFWTVATVPTTTTFTATLNTTPSGSASVLGTARLMADRAIFVGGRNASRMVANGNRIDHATAGVTLESGSPEVVDLQINNNVVSNFSEVGVGVTTSSGTPGLWAERSQVNDNVVRGVDGTTAFGNAGKGSVAGLELVGSTLSAADNLITNVRQGIYCGEGSWAVDEVDHSIMDNTIVLATDATGQGVKVEHTDSTTALRRLKVQGNNIDGQLGTTSDAGILLKGRIIGFDLIGNTVRGMGRSGIKLEASSTEVPANGVITSNICVDNANAGSTAINKVGIAIDSAADDVILGLNKCYDTRGGSALQTYGLHVAATATSIRSTNDDFAGNLTDEVSDLSSGAGFRRTSSRDPRGVGGCYTVDPRLQNGSGSIGANNRIVYARVQGGGRFSKVRVWFAAVDAGTPGTTDQVYVAVYGNAYNATTGLNTPSVRKATSGAVTAATTAAGDDISLAATVEIRDGDWIALGIASTGTTVHGATSGNGPANGGFNGYEDGLTPPAPPTTPAATAGAGTTLRVPVMVGVP